MGMRLVKILVGNPPQSVEDLVEEIGVAADGLPGWALGQHVGWGGDN